MPAFKVSFTEETCFAIIVEAENGEEARDIASNTICNNTRDRYEVPGMASGLEHDRTEEWPPSFEYMKRFYPSRFTMEHVPSWAHQPTSEGKYYAPQYRTDREWFDNVRWSEIGEATWHNQSWPLGEWLDKPFTTFAT